MGGGEEQQVGGGEVAAHHDQVDAKEGHLMQQPGGQGAGIQGGQIVQVLWKAKAADAAPLAVRHRLRQHLRDRLERNLHAKASPLRPRPWDTQRSTGGIDVRSQGDGVAPLWTCVVP